MSADIPLPAYAPDHPAFAGHFPGNPMVPGVLLLDAAVHALCEDPAAGPAGPATDGWRIDSVKFTGVVRPGEPLAVQGETGAGGAFSVLQGGRKVASGSLAPVRGGGEGT